jgi:hypothetical protein
MDKLPGVSLGKSLSKSLSKSISESLGKSLRELNTPDKGVRTLLDDSLARNDYLTSEMVDHSHTKTSSGNGLPALPPRRV